MISVYVPPARRKVGVGLLLYNDHIGVSKRNRCFHQLRLSHSHAQRETLEGHRCWVHRAARGLEPGELAERQPDQAFNGTTNAAPRPNFSAGAYYYSKTLFL